MNKIAWTAKEVFIIKYNCGKGTKYISFEREGEMRDWINNSRYSMPYIVFERMKEYNKKGV